ncbi:peptidase domain-containing ABC transporter [Chitinophaga sp.]|uniref:peptidase domain-containing ABC transporter n=1 Tax=Chitinophaga sp. TaxID=1869181 RepID=UPI0031D35891
MKKHIRRTFVRQQASSDCGVACLLSVLQFYGGSRELEQLRILSGTQVTGTTLLGLHHAATQCGMEAAGCKADMAALQAHDAPVILHVELEGAMQHYVVCYGFEQGKAQVGDPQQGLLWMEPAALAAIWKSGVCLTLQPGAAFEPDRNLQARKRRWFLQLLEEDKPVLLVAVAIGVGMAVLQMSMAVFSQKLIDEIIPRRQFDRFMLSMALLLVLLLAREGLQVLRQYALLKQSHQFNLRITGSFYKRLLQLPQVFFDSRKIGDLTARLNDTARIQKVIGQMAGNTVIDLLLIVVSLVFITRYSPGAGLLAAAFIPLFTWLFYRYNRPVFGAQQAVLAGHAGCESNYISTLRGVQAIRNLQQQPTFESINKQYYRHYQDKVLALGKLQVRLGFMANALGILFMLAVLAYTTWQVFEGKMKAGELVSVLGISGSILPCIANIAVVCISLNEAKVAFSRMFEFFAMPAEEEGGLQQEAAADKTRQAVMHDGPRQGQLYADVDQVAVSNLSFRYPGQRQLLRQVSFHVRKGEIIAVMGENGCGKSTISALLQRHYLPEEGHILVNGTQPLQALTLEHWRSVTGVVPQQVHMFNGSVLENIAFEDAHTKTPEVIAFLQAYGFIPFLEQLPQSYHSLAGEGGISLSGGQQQMIALARTLYRRPQFLVLDEATAAMDRQAETFVLELLMRLKKEMAVIFITHRLHVLKHIADRIYVLGGQTVTAAGSHAELLATDNLYSAYWGDLTGEKMAFRS